jgi:hypothetical protein
MKMSIRLFVNLLTCHSFTYKRALSLPVKCGCTIDYLYDTDMKQLRVISRQADGGFHVFSVFRIRCLFCLIWKH